MNKIPIRQIKEPELPGSFSIQEVGTLVAADDMVQELHRHNFYFVLMLEKGEGEHIIDFTPYPVEDHAVFFMRPGQVHQLTLKRGSTGYLLAFDSGFYLPREASSNQLFRKVSSKNHCHLEARKTKDLLFILANMFREYSEKQEKYREAILANLELFFIELVRQSRNKESKSHAPYALERLEEFLAHVERNMVTNKQVTHYASMMNMSSFQLNAMTKEMLGKTGSRLINEQLILEAKRQLLATSGQVNQIAWDLGYEDASYFIRFFKKHTGFSPEAFRQNFK